MPGPWFCPTASRSICPERLRRPCYATLWIGTWHRDWSPAYWAPRPCLGPYRSGLGSACRSSRRWASGNAAEWLRRRSPSRLWSCSAVWIACACCCWQGRCCRPLSAPAFGLGSFRPGTSLPFGSCPWLEMPQPVIPAGLSLVVHPFAATAALPGRERSRVGRHAVLVRSRRGRTAALGRGSVLDERSPSLLALAQPDLPGPLAVLLWLYLAAGAHDGSQGARAMHPTGAWDSLRVAWPFHTDASACLRQAALPLLFAGATEGLMPSRGLARSSRADTLVRGSPRPSVRSRKSSPKAMVYGQR